MKISWEWLGGFFDGEGCVSCYHNAARARTIGEIRATVNQSGDRGKMLLLEVQEFLRIEGIKSYLCENHSANNRGKGQVCYALIVTGRSHLDSFFRSIRPYVFMKKPVVEDTLRFLIAFPTIKGMFARYDNPRNQIQITLDAEQARKDRESGMTWAALAEKYKTSTTTVIRRIKGINRRATFRPSDLPN